LASGRIVGSPERLAGTVISNVKRRVEGRVREALEASRKIVDSAFEEEYRRLETELRRAVKSAEEKVKAYTAKREVELRKKTSEILSRAVEEIVEEDMGKLREYVGERTYREFLAMMLADAVERLRGRGRIIVRPAMPDQQLVKELAEELKAKGVAVEVGEPVEGKGGFLASAPEAGLTIDYRLEVILAPALEEARARIVEILRG
jgi:V/A-type H+-transporting ATPase subunit E